MDDVSLADVRHQTAPETREQRALALYRERGDEIREIGTDLFEVPSCTGEGRYQVDYESETCSCMDHLYRPGRPCKHLYAVGIVYAKTHRRVSIAGDPFAAAGLSKCAACYDGFVYIGHLVEDPETGEEAEIIESVPCKRCREGR